MEDDVAIQQQNEQNLARLMVSLETSAPRLSLLLAICEDDVLRDELIGRYERELPKGIGAYRVKLAREEPSLRMALANLVQKESALQEKPIAVVSVLGAEVLRTWLPVIDPSSNDGRVAQQTEREKFFGYLQWTREGLREFPFAIVLWLTQELYRDIARKAPDFWSWRDGVFEFKSLRRSLIAGSVVRQMGMGTGEDAEDFFYSIPELEERIAQVVAKFGAMDRSLITLYGQLARMYTARLSEGVSANLGFEKDLAIDYFRKTIELQEHYELQGELAETLLDFGRCFYYQVKMDLALIKFNRALNIYREIGDRLGEANTLQAIGYVLQFLKRSTEALERYEAALAFYREIGDHLGEANTLKAIGDVLQFLDRRTEALERYEAAMAIYREIGSRVGEANVLLEFGKLLDNPQDSLKAYDKSQTIYQQIGSRFSQGRTLLQYIADAYLALNDIPKAIAALEQAAAIGEEIGYPILTEYANNKIRSIQ